MNVAIHTLDKSLVFALDDKWGNGKTSFVKMMSSDIENSHVKGFDVIYFDVFENDYQSIRAIRYPCIKNIFTAQ